MKFDIKQFNPCREALKWYESQPDTETAWETCPRGDWMLWIATKLIIDRKLLCRAAALSANTVRHLMGDERSTDAIDTVLTWCDGKASIEDIEKARVAAADAAYAAAADVAYAAYAAAADAAAAAADAAAVYAAAAYAAYAADAAAAAAAADKKENQLQTANICRKILTKAVMERIKEYEIRQS